ncbi:MAG: hypothetical protein GY755_02150, partial [Chloroflexi bacterium]|nr:hypothetical protein [Chloroflexota bacterium]
MDCIAPTTPIIPSPNNIHTNQIPSQNNLFIQQNPIHSIPTISPIPTINTISVSYKTYLNILNSSNKCLKIIKCIITILLMIGAQICLVTSQFWLGLCASQPPQKQQSNKTFEYIYYLLAICTIVLSLWRCAFIFNELLHSAEILHNEMFIGVLYSKMIFFESNPLGRILNRFSKDQQLIDDKLPLATYDWIESITTCFIVFILIGCINLYLYIICIPIIILIIYYSKLFLSCSRILKRLDANTRSPIYSLFNIIFNGINIIRIFKKQKYIFNKILNMIDINTRIYITYHSCVHWLGFRLDICVFIITPSLPMEYLNPTACSNSNNCDVLKYNDFHFSNSKTDKKKWDDLFNGELVTD